MSIPIIGAAVAKAFAAIGSAAPALQAGLGIATTGMNYLAQRGAADAQQQANDQANERARQYMIEDYDQTSRMVEQERAAASQKIGQNQIDAAKTAASAQVAATAGGVSGLSVDALLADIYGQEAVLNDSVNQNLENTGHQIGMERANIQRGYTTAINTRPTPQHPSLFGTVLEAGTSVLGAYKDHIKVRGKTG